MPFQNGSSFEYITIDVKIRKYQDNLRIFSNLNQKYHMLLYYYKISRFHKFESFFRTSFVEYMNHKSKIFTMKTFNRVRDTI